MSIFYKNNNFYYFFIKKLTKKNNSFPSPKSIIFVGFLNNIMFETIALLYIQKFF